MAIDPKSKTATNLYNAVLGESQTSLSYLQYARRARHDGENAVADAFENAACNEREHANLWMKLLELVGPSEQNLRRAVEGEHGESSEMYPKFAREATEEGYKSTAWLFERIAEIERRHETIFSELLSSLRQTHEAAAARGGRKFCAFCGHELGADDTMKCTVCDHNLG